MGTPLGDILEDYDRLIPITILGVTYQVPENNILLRLLQYLRFDIMYGRFCWNGDCKNCALRFRKSTGQEGSALGCQLVVQPGLKVLQLPTGINPPNGNSSSED